MLSRHYRWDMGVQRLARSHQLVEDMTPKTANTTKFGEGVREARLYRVWDPPGYLDPKPRKPRDKKKPSLLRRVSGSGSEEESSEKEEERSEEEKEPSGGA